MSTELPDHDGVPPARGRVPDFFIVGHHKSGTTAMYEMLRGHPQIFMPDMKEPEFFGKDHPDPRTLPPKEHRQPKTYAETRPQTYAEYLSLFDAAAPDQRVGEASPSYLNSARAAGEIAAVQPAARIIAILREPASFLHSLHLQLLRSRVETERDLRRAIDGEKLTPSGSRLSYADRVRYVEQLRRYHDVFPPEQVLVLIYDDFRTDNHATVHTVLRFLDVDPDVPINPAHVNRAIMARSPRLNDWWLRARAGRGPVSRHVKATFKLLTPRRSQRMMVRAVHRNVIYGGAPPLDERLMYDLRQRFKPEVVALSEYLKRDLVGLWGYDSIG